MKPLCHDRAVLLRSSSVYPCGRPTMNRRDLLSAFLGMPFALAGCGRTKSKAARIPPGELVGASVGIGHRLRDGLKAEVPEDHWETRRVVIVGAGIAGLSAARMFRKAGLEDFTLLEIEPK